MQPWRLGHLKRRKDVWTNFGPSAVSEAHTISLGQFDMHQTLTWTFKFSLWIIQLDWFRLFQFLCIIIVNRWDSCDCRIGYVQGFIQSCITWHEMARSWFGCHLNVFTFGLSGNLQLFRFLLLLDVLQGVPNNACCPYWYLSGCKTMWLRGGAFLDFFSAVGAAVGHQVLSLQSHFERPFGLWLVRSLCWLWKLWLLARMKVSILLLYGHLDVVWAQTRRRLHMLIWSNAVVHSSAPLHPRVGACRTSSNCCNLGLFDGLCRPLWWQLLTVSSNGDSCGSGCQKIDDCRCFHAWKTCQNPLEIQKSVLLILISSRDCDRWTMKMMTATTFLIRVEHEFWTVS